MLRAHAPRLPALAGLEDNVVATETTMRRREDEWQLREATGGGGAAHGSDTLGLGSRSGLLVGSPRRTRPTYPPHDMPLPAPADGGDALRPGHAETINKLESTDSTD